MMCATANDQNNFSPSGEIAVILSECRLGREFSFRFKGGPSSGTCDDFEAGLGVTLHRPLGSLALSISTTLRVMKANILSLIQGKEARPPRVRRGLALAENVLSQE